MNNKEKLQKLSDLWSSQAKSASVEQKNKVGIAFITEVLKLDKETALNFIQGDEESLHQVGLAQSDLPRNKDLSNFWNRVREVFPQYEESDIEFLKQKGEVPGVWKFLNQLGESSIRKSPVLETLLVNAHIYK